jgi:hypothetical protein
MPLFEDPKLRREEEKKERKTTGVVYIQEGRYVWRYQAPTRSGTRSSERHVMVRTVTFIY